MTIMPMNQNNPLGGLFRRSRFGRKNPVQQVAQAAGPGLRGLFGKGMRAAQQRAAQRQQDQQHQKARAGWRDAFSIIGGGLQDYDGGFGQGNMDAAIQRVEALRAEKAEQQRLEAERARQVELLDHLDLTPVQKAYFKLDPQKATELYGKDVFPDQLAWAKENREAENMRVDNRLERDKYDLNMENIRADNRHQSAQLGFDQRKHDEDYGYRAQQDAITNQLRQGQLDVQRGRLDFDREKQAAEPFKAPTVHKITLEDGSQVAVQFNPNTGAWDPLNAPSGGKSVRSKEKLTESQSKLRMFESLQQEATGVLTELEEKYNPANVQDAAARNAPIAPAFFKSEDGQIYDASATAWAEGALRIFTGAAATEPEIRRIKSAFFAQVGDTAKTVEHKQELREAFSRSIKRGQGYTVDEWLQLNVPEEGGFPASGKDDENTTDPLGLLP